MIINKKSLAIIVIFLAFFLFLAIAQENVTYEEENLTEEASIYEDLNISAENESLEFSDFQIFTVLEKSKLKRGESFDYTVKVKNSGNKVLESLKIYLVLPEGMDSDKDQEICENIGINETCEVVFKVKTSISTLPGKKEIKVRVIYG